ncbi:MAG: non-canonical purine NTP pyrophosphatase, partial [Candidatus Diapherotrites archaeon]|nr:non-canonical purine NTP pyrophosphatase [Candidatus Diapherotrites archaeon]
EVAEVLAPQIVLSRESFEFLEDSDLSIEEVAQEKAKQAFAHFNRPLIVEDTGVFFEAYHNFPGSLAKRIYNAIGVDGLLKLLEGKSRRAYFEVVLVYTDGNITKSFVGKSFGTIAQEQGPKSPRLQMGYEMLFVPDGHLKYLSEFSIPEKAGVSHRVKAANAFKEWFLKMP